MPNYALICALAAGCLATDGTTQPQGTAMAGPVLWDGVTAFSLPGLTITPWTGQTVYAPPPAALTAAQKAAALTAGGLTVTSAATPALDGVYAIDATAQNDLTATQTFIAANGHFPTGVTMPWVDVSGAPHVFATTTEFTAFASAIATVVVQVQLYGDGVLASPPSMSVTIP